MNKANYFDTMKKQKLSLLFILALFTAALGQQPTVELLTSGTKTSLRGLSVVNDNVIWVSGSNGTVGKSLNGGKNWKWITVKGFEKTDFRDIEAFDAGTAIIMGIADPAYILKTIDGGDTWKVVYENKTKGMFLDAMDFYGKHGMVVGDPINDKVFLAETKDGGDTWAELPVEKRLRLDTGEAFFASSGTNIRLFSDGNFLLASGGTKSNLLTKNKKLPLPIVQGKESTGANSLDVFDSRKGRSTTHMIVVGGDFTKDSVTDKNCFVTYNGGKKWIAPKEPPHGYRSCVEYLSKDDLLTCGLNGVDYSRNGGKNWQWISKDGFHVCRIAKSGTAIFLAGGNGKIGKIIWR
jgi:photosystem II stability/assembly factor-like uncharacterized protein